MLPYYDGRWGRRAAEFHHRRAPTLVGSSRAMEDEEYEGRPRRGFFLTTYKSRSPAGPRRKWHQGHRLPADHPGPPSISPRAKASTRPNPGHRDGLSVLQDDGLNGAPTGNFPPRGLRAWANFVQNSATSSTRSWSSVVGGGDEVRQRRLSTRRPLRAGNELSCASSRPTTAEAVPLPPFRDAALPGRRFLFRRPRRRLWRARRPSRSRCRGRSRPDSDRCRKKK